MSATFVHMVGALSTDRANVHEPEFQAVAVTSPPKRVHLGSPRRAPGAAGPLYFTSRIPAAWKMCGRNQSRANGVAIAPDVRNEPPSIIWCSPSNDVRL